MQTVAWMTQTNKHMLVKDYERATGVECPDIRSTRRIGTDAIDHTLQMELRMPQADKIGNHSIALREIACCLCDIMSVSEGRYA